jgi:DEAD/DEAH box helicase domain-containing protein
VADTIVLDLETQKSFDEVGGRTNLHLLRVSVTGIYSYDQDQFKIFTEWETPEVGNLLLKAGLIVGFNIKRFDFPVLEPYLKRSLKQLPVLDILEVVERHLGHRLSLDHIAQATLGESKTGSGLDAIHYFRNGEIEKLKSYCLSDVRLTRDLYDYGKHHSFLRYQRNQAYYSLPVKW